MDLKLEGHLSHSQVCILSHIKSVIGECYVCALETLFIWFKKKKKVVSSAGQREILADQICMFASKSFLKLVLPSPLLDFMASHDRTTNLEIMFWIKLTQSSVPYRFHFIC